MSEEITKKQPNRYLILAAATLCATGPGAIYMWSVFNSPLMAKFGYTLAGASMTYSMFLLCSAFGYFVSGWLQNRGITLRFIVFGSGIGFGLGWLLTGFTSTLITLYMAFGGLAGLCNGILASVVIGIAVKWFPDHRGIANGICVGAIGLCPAFLAPIGNMLVESFDVSMAFIYVGIFWIVLYGIFAWVLQNPEPGWMPEGYDPSTNEAVKQSVHEFKTLEMLRQPSYWVLLATMTTAGVAGYLTAGQGANIAQLQVGLTAGEAALMVSILAVGSFCGRFGIGFLSDKIGRLRSLQVSMSITVVVMLFFLGNAHDFVSLIICLALVGAGLGSIFTLLPALTGDLFGSVNFGMNYACVFPGATIASFVGPMIATSTVDVIGSYQIAFTVAGLSALVCIILCSVLIRLSAKMLAQYQE